MPWLSYASLLAGMMVVGAYVGFSKTLTLTFPVFVLATLRFAIAAVVLLPWTFGSAINKNQIKAILIQSFFGNFLFSICLLYGVSLSSAVAGGLIMSTLPAAVALLSAVVLKERLSHQTWLAVAMSVAAISILQFGGIGNNLGKSENESLVNAHILNAFLSNTDQQSPAAQSHFVGNFLLFGAVLCEAIYVVQGKRLSGSMSANRNSALLNLAGLAFMLPFGLWQMRGFDFSQVSVPMWQLLIAYAIAASVLSTWLWLTGLRKVPASQAGVFSIGLPVTAMLVGVVFLNEKLTAFHIVALVFSVVALLLISLQTKASA